VTKVIIPYQPRPLQRELHDAVRRFNVLVCHRRFGKTVFGINHALRAALTCPLERPRFAYIAPFRSQAKTVAWDYVKNYSRPIPGTEFNEAELRADLPNGGRITLFGADNADALRGQYFDGVILDEFAQMSPRVWAEIIRPALSDRKGWAIFIGTPMGENQFYEIYEYAREAGGDWFAASHKASETGLIDAAELKEARRAMTPAQYAQEFECSFSAAIIGAIYGDLLEEATEQGRVTSVPWERGHEVHTAWDLGVGDDTVIWFFQEVGREVRIIDCYAANGVGLDHYVRVINSKPYTYGRHLWPHDGVQQEKGTGLRLNETARNLGLNVQLQKRTGPELRINAARMAFSRLWFDAKNCADGIKALRQYRYEYNEKTRAYRLRPLHDWTSHYADAFGAMCERLGFTRVSGPKPVMDTSWIT
jgi:phage terminase large subunit